MTIRRITFCCNASTIIGGGHVMRCISLAKAYLRAGYECVFICNKEAESMIPQLSDFEVFTEGTYIHTDIVVIDNYDCEESYEKKWRKYAKLITVIDDLANRSHDCDVLIDMTFGRQASDYKDFVASDATLLVGHEFVILRPQFSEYRQKAFQKRQNTSKIENVLISFGMTNPDQVTERVLQSVMDFKRWPLNISVVMGKDAQTIDDVKALTHVKSMHNISLNLNVSNMAEYIYRADMAIGASGTASWERCCLGLPSLQYIIADNQRLVAQNLEEAGVIINLGKLEDTFPEKLTSDFAQIIQNPEKLKEMAIKAYSICDSLGAERIIQEISRR